MYHDSKTNVAKIDLDRCGKNSDLINSIREIISTGNICQETFPCIHPACLVELFDGSVVTKTLKGNEIIEVARRNNFEDEIDYQHFQCYFKSNELDTIGKILKEKNNRTDYTIGVTEHKITTKHLDRQKDATMNMTLTYNTGKILKTNREIELVKSNKQHRICTLTRIKFSDKTWNKISIKIFGTELITIYPECLNQNNEFHLHLALAGATPINFVSDKNIDFFLEMIAGNPLDQISFTRHEKINEFIYTTFEKIESNIFASPDCFIQKLLIRCDDNEAKLCINKIQNDCSEELYDVPLKFLDKINTNTYCVNFGNDLKCIGYCLYGNIDIFVQTEHYCKLFIEHIMKAQIGRIFNK